MIKDGEKYLVTADSWFYGTDGHQYRAAYGVCKVVEFKDAFGFVPARPSTNWMLQVGEGERQVLIAGCQIHYLIKTDTPPAMLEGEVTDRDGDKAPANRIFFTELPPPFREYGLGDWKPQTFRRQCDNCGQAFDALRHDADRYDCPACEG